MGMYAFDEIFSKRAEISSIVTTELEKEVKAWGIDLKGVEIGELSYDNEIYRALQKKRIAEAEKDAKMTTIESEALTAIKKAKTQLEQKEIEIQMKRNEAAAEAEILQIQAAGKAKALEIEAQGISKANAIKQETENKYIADLAQKVGKEGAVQLTAASIAVQGLNVLGHNHNQKLVVLPNDFKGMMKLVGIESPKND
jgi:regulator of protease activity HflC (stomatin/prohibitin superfamily)